MTERSPVLMVSPDTTPAIYLSPGNSHTRAPGRTPPSQKQIKQLQLFSNDGELLVLFPWPFVAELCILDI